MSRATLPRLALVLLLSISAGSMALASVFLTFGVPGIPRGAFIMLAPLFAALGLPVEGIGILIAVDAIPDTFATVLNVSGHLAAVTIVSSSATPSGAPTSAGA